MAGILVSSFSVAGGGALLASRHYNRRIRELKDFASAVAEGNFQPLEMRPGGDSLDLIGKAFNRTAAQLTGTIGVLTDERNRSAAILRSMIEGVAVISPQERIVFSNRAFMQILGLADFPIEGRLLLEVVRQSDLLAIIKKALAGSEQLSSEIVVGTVGCEVSL